MDTDVSASIDVNKNHGLCTLESGGTDDLYVNILGNDVIESVNINRYEIPSSRPPYNDNDVQKKEKAIDSSCSCSSSPGATLKPVSAMKGSRAGPPQKLTVKWAPEVYDPVPTSASHAVANNKPQKQGKKKSKSKQKNGSKSSRGNKHKDKLAGKRGGV